MNFGEYLESCIRNRKLSINALSNICGINRGGLYNVFKQQRKLKPDQLYKLISAIGLSSKEEETLVALYFQEYCGKENYRKITSFLNLLQTCETNSPSENMEQSDNREVLGALKDLIEQNEHIITNFPFQMHAVDELFFRAVKQKRFQTFTHIFAFDENENCAYNFQALFRAIKYMHLKSFPLYYYTVSMKIEKDTLLPYFAVGENTAVLFSDERAIYLTDRVKIDILKTVAQALADRCTPLGRFEEDVMQIMSLYQSSLTNDNEILFTYYPCLAKFVTYEMMQRVVRPLPNKDMLVNLAYSHYRYIYKNVQPIQFTTEDGLRRFAATGNLMEVPKTLIHVLNCEDRIAVLQAMKEDVLSRQLFLINADKFYFPKGITIEKFRNHMIFGGYDAQEPNFFAYSHFFSQINDSSLISVVQYVAEYLMNSHLTLPQMYTLQILESIIVELKNQKN